MRRLLSLIALFSLTTLAAQDLAKVNHALPTSSRILIYPTEDEAAKQDFRQNNRYNTLLTDWTVDGHLFTTRFTMPFAWLNRQVVLRVGATSGEYVVRVNGHMIHENSVGALAGSFALTPYVKEGANLLEIELNPHPTYAKLEDWTGKNEPFVRDVRLMSPPKMHIRDVVTSTWRADKQKQEATAQIGIIVKTETLNPRTSQFYYTLHSPLGERIKMGNQELTLALKEEDTLRVVGQIPYPMMWSPANPKLYDLRIKTKHEGRFVEYVSLPVGFCLVERDGGRLMINGEPIALRGAEVDPTISNREIDDLKLAKCNLMVLRPGALRDDLLDYCDQVGMFVIVQAPIDTHTSGLSRRRGGNPSNDPAFRDEFLKRTEQLFHATKRHPSILAFSLAHLSANGINLYESYLNLKHFADPRPVIYPDAAGEWNNDPLQYELVTLGGSASNGVQKPISE